MHAALHLDFQCLLKGQDGNGAASTYIRATGSKKTEVKIRGVGYKQPGNLRQFKDGRCHCTPITGFLASSGTLSAARPSWSAPSPLHSPAGQHLCNRLGPLY